MQEDGDHQSGAGLDPWHVRYAGGPALPLKVRYREGVALPDRRDGPDLFEALEQATAVGWHADDREPGDESSVRDVVRAHRWLLDAMLQQFPNGSINVFDRDLRYLYAAGEGLEQVGLEPTALIGKRLADLFSAESVAHVEPSYKRAFDGETIVFELTVFGRQYTIHASPLHEPSGGITAIVAVVQEIPARPRSATELTPRQREVATLVAAGLTNEQIAHHLVITRGTTANHIEGILRRLSFVGRAQIAVWATECGLYRSTPGESHRAGGTPQRPR